MVRRRRKQGDFNAEIEAHLQFEADRLRKQGLSPEEARMAARRAFGNVTRAQERFYESGRWLWWDHLAQDVRFGLRVLARNPGFSAVAILTLALGIGVNTAIFSMVDGLLLRPFPVKDPEQVSCLFYEHKGGGYSNGFSYPDLEGIRKQSTEVFSDMAGVQPYQMEGLSANGKSAPMWTSYVTGNFFEMLGIRPVLGRLILPSEGTVVGADPVLVLGYSFWKTHFGGDPSVVGKKVSVDGYPVRIVGVAPEGFRGVVSFLDTQGYLPLGMASINGETKRDFMSNREARDIIPIARLKPGVDLRKAQSALAVVARRVAQQYPESNDWVALHATPLGPLGPRSDPSDTLAVVATLFLVLAGLVLILACVNVANIQLVRASARQREMAVRAALGARRGRLIRQMLTESLILALLGCAAGTALGVGGSHGVSSIPLQTVIPIVLDFGFDWRVLAYALVATLVTGMVVGTAPALRASRHNLSDVLHAGGRSSTARGVRLRNALVVSQVGGSLMLLIIAGLFVRSLRNVQHVDLGFNPNHILNLSLDPHEAGYNETRARAFYREVLARVRALPGVQSASMAGTIPMGYYSRGASLKIEGYQPPSGHGTAFAGYNTISPGYFEMMRIPLLRGRDFRDSDGPGSQHVAVINGAMAERFWSGQDPIGRQFTTTDDLSHPLEVVGVVKNSKTADMYSSVRPYFYTVFAQKYMLPATLQVRTAAAPETMAHGVVGIIASLEPAMPVFDVQTMTQALDTLNGLLLFKLGAALAASLGILGLTLAVVGIYGVSSYAVSQRTHEIGIRMALGAQRRGILKMILRQGLFIVAIGVVVGMLAAWALGSLMRDLLVGVAPTDSLTHLSLSLLLGLVALTASFIPARRATKVDPMVALRYE
jgi:predicted permease